MSIEDGIARERKCRRITKTVAQLIVGTRSYVNAEAREANELTTVKKVCKILRDGIELPSDSDDEERNRERTVSKTIYPAVRSALFGMYREKRHATLDSLLKVLETQHSTRAISWVWSRATLHRILTQEMFFTYGARRQSLQSYQREVLRRSAASRVHPACAPLSRGGKSCVLPRRNLDDE